MLAEVAAYILFSLESKVAIVAVYLEGYVLLVCSKLHTSQNLEIHPLHWYGTVQL